MEDTAVLDQVDDAPAPEATEELAPADSAEANAATELDDPEGTTDSEPDDPLADLPEAVVKAIDAKLEATRKAERKAAEAKAAESLRQRDADREQRAREQAQAETFRQNAQRANAVRTGGAAKVLNDLVEQARDTGKDVEAQSLVNLATNMNAAAFHEAHAEFGHHLWTSLKASFPSYQPSQEAAAAAARAATSYDRAGMVAAQTQMLREAIESELRPKVKAEVTAELTRKTTAAAKADGLRQNAGKAEQRPTGGAAASSGRGLTLAEINAMPTQEWLSKPKQERERLLADAHAKANR